MSTPDLINAAFEIGGGFICWSNVLRLRRDRQVKGVSWWASAFFATFGAWNMAYYPMLGQWASFGGGIVMCLGNLAWLALALRFRSRS